MPSPFTPVRPPSAATVVASQPAPAAGQLGDTRNRAAWLSIADFLARQNLRHVLAQQQRAAAQKALRP